MSDSFLAMLGVLSSIRHPPKSARCVTLRGDATKMRESRLNPFAPNKGGPSAKRTLMVRAWSAHGRWQGADGLACGPITSGGRIDTLTRHMQRK